MSKDLRAKAKFLLNIHFLKQRKSKMAHVMWLFAWNVATLHQIIDRVLYSSINTIAIVKAIVQ